MLKKLFCSLSFFSIFAALAQPLSGSYSVGGMAPNYDTVIAAVAAIEENGISGPVIFNIRSGIYNAQSFFLTEISGQSAANTITFKSESGNPADVVFTATKFTFWQGSQNVIVKDISFSGNARKIDLDGNSAYIGNFNISNCIFTNTLPLGNGSLSDINFANAVTQIGIQNGYQIVINGNTFNNAGIAVRKSGNLTDNLTISNNTINGGIMPISVYQGRNVTVSGNIYTGTILGNAISLTSMDDNLTITGNRFISNSIATGASSGNITGNYTAGTNLHMRNNFFSTTQHLTINSFVNTNIHFNSFKVSNSFCLDITNSSELIAYNIYNNIFENGSSRASIRAHMPANLPAVHSNNNAYSNATMIYTRYWSGDSTTTYEFNEWKTFSGEDSNSKIVNNVFAFPPDLHTGNSILLSGAGTPIAGITTDIDGQPRHATAPDIGADEFDMVPSTFRDLALSIVTPTAACDATSISVSVQNLSAFPISGFEIECAINNNRGNITSFIETLAPGASTVLDLQGCAITPNTWYEKYEVFVSNPAGELDNNYANDRVVFENLFQYGPFEIKVENSDCDEGRKLYVPQFFGATQLWSTGATTALITAAGPGEYSVTITDIGGCTTTKSITIE